MTDTSQWRRSFLICLCLAAVTAAVYRPVRHFEFTNYDDPSYVTENPHVQGGLTLPGVVWAFTSTHFSIWMPVTWLSCMADCRFFGLNSGAHHLVNVLFHVANTLLLFILLKRMTAAPWRSAFVAALFALHPLHVESVAWVAERKDVLSTLFWMLTMLAYVHYVEKPNRTRYALTMGVYALGLMSKPMLVTLPIILLLLDYWPLGRTHWVPSGVGTITKRSAGFLLREKLPFLALMIPASVVTYWAEQRGGSVILLDKLPIAARFANALISYVRYLGNTLWPVNLAVYYPYQTWSFTTVCGAAAVLAVVSWFVVWQVKRQPHLITGWLWYLGTLVPVIGLVQVGTFTMADRYTYIPSVGLFMMLAWSLPGTPVKRPLIRIAAVTAAAALLLSCTLVTAQQIQYWQNSETLFRHALRVTKNNLVAHENLGKTLAEHGHLEEATSEFLAALRINPASATAHSNLASALAAQGRFAEATLQYQAALRIKPDSAEAHYNLGVALASQSKLSDAIGEFARARQLDPEHAQAHYNLGALLASQGRIAEATAEYREAIHLRPNWPLPLKGLAWILATNGKANFRNAGEAVQLAERLCTLTNYQQVDALDTLAAAYADAGRFGEAIQIAQKAIASANVANKKDLAAPIRERLNLYQAGQPYREG
jgi:Flp pilus assembly protein TadD